MGWREDPQLPAICQSPPTTPRHPKQASPYGAAGAYQANPKASFSYLWEAPTAPGTPTVIELAVGLLAVDDVKAVRDGSPHPAHPKVEPLLVLGAANVSVDQQVILEPAGRGEMGGSPQGPREASSKFSGMGPRV